MNELETLERSIDGLVRPATSVDYAEWLAGFPWTTVVTLTFADWTPAGKPTAHQPGLWLAPPRAPHGDDVSVAKAQREFFKFRRDLEQRSQSAVGYAVAYETTYSGRAHIHGALIVEGIDVAEISRAWRRGRKLVEAFDAERGWLYYMSKRVPDGAEWDFRLDPWQELAPCPL